MKRNVCGRAVDRERACAGSPDTKRVADLHRLRATAIAVDVVKRERTTIGREVGEAGAVNARVVAVDRYAASDDTTFGLVGVGRRARSTTLADGDRTSDAATRDRDVSAARSSPRYWRLP